MNKTNARRRVASLRRGMTLVELMVTIAIGGIVLGGITYTFNMWLRSSMAVGNYADMSSECRRALDVFASDARMIDSVTESTATSFSFRSYGSGTGTVPVSYVYDAAAGELVRTYNGVRQVLLSNVERFSFSYYNLSRAATVNPLSVKEVQVEAILQKRVIQLANTDEIISARFMLRNRSVST